MFARWLFVRLNAVERAIRQGRIDQACAALRDDDLRAHPRGQKLLDKLVKPLTARARLHRQAGRYQEALADLDTLAVFGRTRPEIKTLRQQIEDEFRQHSEQNADAKQAYARAADHVRAGRLETGRLDLQRIDDTRQRADVAEQLDLHVQRSTELLHQATDALDRGDVLGALRFWHDARQRHGRTDQVEAFASRLAAAVRQELELWLREGRIERMMAIRSSLDTLLPLDPTLRECERALSLCSQAVSQLSSNDHTELRQTLLRLKAAGGDAAWVNDALDALAKVAEGQELLLASPLGLFTSTSELGGDPVAATGGPRTVRIEAATRQAPAEAANALHLDRSLLVLVDGGSSCLLVPNERVRLGRGPAMDHVDVPLPGDIHAHHADIIRRGEDYFLTAYGPATVNRRPIEQALLHDGERIVLGSKAKMTFSKPSSKSESAVLRLSHRCRLPQDVSEVILFSQTCLIGPDARCHVRMREGDTQVVLFERGGALHARQSSGKGWEDAPARMVTAGKPMEFGDLRLTIKPYEVDSRGAGV